MRIGIGYDIHRLIPDKPLVLGGIRIPYEKGLDAHSDGDVLLHAVADAILGAAALGDIGVHFPDSDPKYKGISSTKILTRVNDIVSEKGYRINNVDSVIVTETPKINPFSGKMRDKIAKILNIDKTRVSVKATTNEKTGGIGRGEAIASYAAVTLESVNAA